MTILAENYTNYNKKAENKLNYSDIAQIILSSRYDSKEYRNRIAFQCPVHNGGDLNASVRPTKDGFQCKCFSHGCSHTDIVNALTSGHSNLTALPKIERKEVAPTQKKFNHNVSHIVDVYVYTDTDGQPLYQKLRMLTVNADGTRKQYKSKSGKMVDAPKFIYRYEINGEWYYGKGNCVDHFLYNTKELANAEIVYICEGEKDANNLNEGLKELGLFGKRVATSTHDGASGNWTPTYTKQLAGKTIVIFPDSDEVGVAHAKKISDILLQHCNVKVVPLPNSKKGYDVSDYLADYSTKELLQSVRKVKSNKLTVSGDQYLSDVLTSFEQLPQYTNLVAYTGIGKSTATMELLKAVGKGIYLCSSVLSLQQLSAKYPTFGVFYQNEKRVAPVTICTYDSFPLLVRKLTEELVDFSTLPLVIDESHNFALAGYRIDALRGVNDVLRSVKFSNVLRMTGTYLPTWTGIDGLFETVKVDSIKRVQPVTVVHFQRHTTNESGETTSVGKMTDSLLVVANYFLSSSKRVIIHFDNKGKGLDSLIAKLVTAGTPSTDIYTLNSDNKFETLGSQLVTTETVPDNCKVLVVTSVFIESLNVATPFDALLVEDLHCAKLEQLFNRKRGSAIPHAFVFTNGQGNGYAFDREKEIAHKRSLLSFICEEANRDETLFNVRMTNDDIRIFGRSYSKGVKRVGDKWTIDELGLSQMVYESEELYLANNPLAFKRHAENSGYGWNFTHDIEVVVSEQPTKEEKQELNAIKDTLKDIRDGRYNDTLAFLSTLQEVAHAEHIAKSLDGLHRRILDRAVELDYKLTELTGDTDSWLNALKLMYSVGGDSTRSHNQLLRLFDIEKCRLNNNELLDMIERSFIGQTMNRDERVELMTALYSVVPELAVFTQEVTLRYYDKKTRTLLTPKDMDELLKTIFNVKSTEREVGGKRENVHKFVSLRTVAGTLTKIANDFMTDIVERDEAQKVLVQPNYSEFQTALEHFAKSIEYIPHSKLSINKEYTEFTMGELFPILHFGMEAVNEYLRELNDIELQSKVYASEPHWNDLDLELTVDECPTDEVVEAFLLSDYEMVKDYISHFA